MDYWKMAQRWHDTDHGDEGGSRPCRTEYIAPDVEVTVWEPVSPCWCCCQFCRRDAPRPNPFYERALDQPSAEILR